MTPARFRNGLLLALIVCCTILYVPWSEDPFRSFRETAVQVAAAGLVLLWLYELLAGGTGRLNGPHRGSKAEYSLALFGISAAGFVVSCAVNGISLHGTVTVVNFFIGGALFAAFHSALNQKNTGKWLAFFIATGLVNAILGVMQYSKIDPFFGSLDPAFHSQYPKYLVAGFLDNPALLAPFLASFIPYLFTRFISETGSVKAAAWGLGLICMLVPVALTRNIVALAGLATVMPVLFAYYAARLWRLRRNVGRLGFCVVAAVLLAFLASHAYLNENEESRTIKMYSIDERLAQNRAALMMYAESPLLGKGPGFFFSHFSEYRRAVWMKNPPRRLPFQTAQQVHNDYAQILAEGGLFAAIPLLALLSYWLAVQARSLLKYYALDSVSSAEAALAGSAGGFWIIAINAFGSFPFHVPTLAVTALFWAALAFRMLQYAP